MSRSSKIGHALLGLLAAMAAGAAEARTHVCGRAERGFDGGRLEIVTRRVDTAPAYVLSVNLVFAPEGAPLGLRATFAGAGDRLGPGELLFATMPKADPHAPTRSLTEFIEVVAADGTGWRSEPQELPYPHAPYPDDPTEASSVLLASAKPPFNPDLLQRLTRSETLVVTRRGDGGEVFATFKTSLPPRAAFDALYAAAFAEASNKADSCAPYFTISAVPPRDWRKPPRLYLGPDDTNLIRLAPTLTELATVDPKLGRGKLRGRAYVACLIGDHGRLDKCELARNDNRAVDEASLLAAERVEIAERWPDGRRTAGLALILSLDWDKRAVRYAIVRANGPPVPQAQAAP
jgi:hypothetical protein